MMNIVIIVIVAIVLLAYIYNLVDAVLDCKRIRNEQRFVADLAQYGCRINDDTGKVEYIPVYAKYGKDSDEDEQQI